LPSRGPGTRFARRYDLRALDVLAGHHLPPRYCHISHRTALIAGIAQGIVGFEARLVEIRAVQTPAPTKLITDVTTTDHRIACIRLAEALMPLLPINGRYVTYVGRARDGFSRWPPVWPEIASA
jgi:hypothetical protein